MSMISSPTASEPPALHPGPTTKREADEPDERSDRGRARDALPCDAPQDDDLERHRAGDHRGDTRVDARLGDVHQPDPEGEERDAEPRGGERLARRDAERAPRDDRDQREDRRGGEEPRAGGEERWQGAHGDLDREVRRAPHEVDDPQRGPQPDPGRAPHAG